MAKIFFKLEQTRHGVFLEYLEYKTKGILSIACLGKKLLFHMAICDYFKQKILNNF